MFSGAFIRHRERKYSETEQQDNEQEHDEQVRPEKPRHATTRADDAGDGDEHEEDADGDDWLLQEALAFSCALAGKPDSGDEDGDGEDECDDVKDSDEIVAEFHHFESARIEVVCIGEEDVGGVYIRHSSQNMLRARDVLNFPIK